MSNFAVGDTARPETPDPEDLEVSMEDVRAEAESMARRAKTALAPMLRRVMRARQMEAAECGALLCLVAHVSEEEFHARWRELRAGGGRDAVVLDMADTVLVRSPTRERAVKGSGGDLSVRDATARRSAWEAESREVYDALVDRLARDAWERPLMAAAIRGEALREGAREALDAMWGDSSMERTRVVHRRQATQTVGSFVSFLEERGWDKARHIRRAHSRRGGAGHEAAGLAGAASTDR